MVIYLQNGFKIKNTEKDQVKKSGESTSDVKKFETHVDLYNHYIKNLNTQNIDDFSCFNEFSYDHNNYLNLFLDIDIDLDSFFKDLKDKRLDPIILKYNNDNHIKNDSNTSSLHLIKYLIVEFVNFILRLPDTKYSTFYKDDDEKIKLSFFYNNADTNNTSTLVKHNFPLLNKLKNEIYENLSITTNEKNNKYSYHIFFNNIVFKQVIIKEIIKPLILNFKKTSKNPFAYYIDEHVYKTNPMLRFIYSKKDNNDKTYHKPLQINTSDNYFDITRDELIIDADNINQFLFTSVLDINKKIIIEEIEFASHDFIHNEVAQHLNTNETNINISESPDIFFLTFKKLLSIIFNTSVITKLESGSELKNFQDFTSNDKVLDSINNLILDFDYSKMSKCMFCDRNKHKNTHKIQLYINGIIIIKNGNPLRCHIKTIGYPNLSNIKICEFIYNKGIIKRLKSDELIVFTLQNGWTEIKNKDYTILKNILEEHSHYFKNNDIKTIEEMSETKMRECFKSLSKNHNPVNVYNPYLFKFNNGILNMKEKIFIPMKDSKEYIVINKADYDYKLESEYTEDEKNKQEFLMTVIDKIMPPFINNKPNIYRDIFEKNISTCILMVSKEIITVFKGKTSAGKSTIKNLIKSINNESHIEIPIGTYTALEGIEANRANAWLGQLENKLVSFASEPSHKDVINSQTIKLMTEPKIIARKLNSNDIGQTSYLTQIIDTNFPFKFDIDDLAAYRRVAVIEFETYFSKPENTNLMVNMTKNQHDNIAGLKEDILNNKYNLQFFNYLLDLCHKHKHFDTLKMVDTYSISPYGMLTNAIINSTFYGVIVELSDIKESARQYYEKTKFCYSTYYTEFSHINLTVFKSRLSYYNEQNDLDINIVTFIEKYKLRDVKGKVVIPLVFIKDIDETKLDKVINKYNAQELKKNNNNQSAAKLFDIEYYNNNKNIFDFENDIDDVLDISNMVSLIV